MADQQPELTPLHVETLVAAIGLAPFVAQKFTGVAGYHGERAEKTPAVIAQKIHRFLVRDEPDPPADLPPFDYDEIGRQLAAEVPPEQVIREVEGFGEAHQMAIAANLVVQRIRQYLAGKYPRRFHQSIVGPEPVPPGASEVARFRRAWVIACKPLSILDDLNEFAISRDQVQALRDMFPTLWATFLPIAQEQITRRKVQGKGKFRLTWQREQLLRILTQQEAPNIDLAHAMQAMYAEQAAKAAPVPVTSKKKKAGDASGEASAADRIDAGG